MISKEDRELLTKSEINVLVQIFELMNFQIESSDPNLQNWASECFKGLEQGITNSHEKSNNCNFMIELALYVVLIPQVLKIQLLVENKELESKLRSKALAYIQNYHNLMVTQNHLGDMIGKDNSI